MIFACWQVLCELAPWLLLGMLLSGLLHAFLPTDFIKRRFQGIGGVVQAVLLGVPLPLCSCGVVPVGIGLKNQGGSDGSSVAFLISTPQTGVDSILVSASFFGWPFAIFKMVLAAITGMVGGVLTELQPQLAAAVSSDPADADLFTHAEPPHAGHAHAASQLDSPWWLRAWEHAVEILQSIWIWLVVGILLSAVINVWLPPSWLTQFSALGIFPAMVLMLLLSIPMYVCATASVPIAAALVQGGLHPAAALVFLMAGPATNVATIGAIRTRFGGRVLTIYLLTLVIGSMLGAWLFSQLVAATVVAGTVHAHDHQSWLSRLSAVFVLALMSKFAWQSLQRTFFKSRLTVTDGGVDTQSINVQGMHCASCVGRLEKALLTVPGVVAVDVELKSETAQVSGDVDRQQLDRAIEAAGFVVGQ